ncbi:type II toxin-antitoxin system PemK/MazF family toxin [Actinomyces sp. B33]|uniref:type II toxin-antitoxin system PemK/MazF family toxin n=1 Tax=Actinomyces sp. B33 TaxID=2942131 RepID=UPI0023404EB8|nr:type II toxin-antitoxin system PemK/MazF family toxin [Actinomyces sp. B33]MDC4232820.1 type II toxin-antitoxin system PemK/MazF family toxin [Actinomyces sp. B33]
MASPSERLVALAVSVLRDLVGASAKPRPLRERDRDGRPRPEPRTARAGAAEPTPTGQRRIRQVEVAEALTHARYAPQADGAADPGEVVWTWVPYEEDASRGKDRPVVVIGREGRGVYVAQLTSKDHDRDAAQEARWGRHWLDIGSGPWDPRGRPSEVRLDRALWVPVEEVRREGAALPRATWEAVVEAMRARA